MEERASAYLDDIIILGRALEEHQKNSMAVLKRLKRAKLKINKEKSKFFQTEIWY